VRAGPTPSQTVGPFFHFGLLDGRLGPHQLWPEAPEALRLRGRVLDGAGTPVPDAMVEVWQPDLGVARSGTDADGWFELLAGTPAARPGEAPHLLLSIFARGLLDRVVTRVYLPDQTAANEADPVLRAVAEPERRARLVARPEPDGLRFDVVLQGDAETPFFAT
jgi:protocatechuate 3,4-dioxygenase alpha subunit